MLRLLLLPDSLLLVPVVQACQPTVVVVVAQNSRTVVHLDPSFATADSDCDVQRRSLCIVAVAVAVVDHWEADESSPTVHTYIELDSADAVAVSGIRPHTT